MPHTVRWLRIRWRVYSHYRR